MLVLKRAVIICTYLNTLCTQRKTKLNGKIAWSADYRLINIILQYELLV